MRIMRLDPLRLQWHYLALRKAALVLTLIAALLVPAQAQAATAKAGATCTKLKATQIVGTKKFTCIKSGKKLIWDKGVALSKVVVKKAQSIEFPAMDNVYLANKALILTKAISTGGLSVTYSASGACTYDSATNTLFLIKIGTCVLTTSQAGDANYLAAESISRSFEILKTAQVISPVSIPEQDLLKFAAYTIEYPSYGNGSPVIMTSKTPTICSAGGKEISFLAVGECRITFNKAGDEVFEDAKPVDVTFQIFMSAKPGDKANPALIGSEVTKSGVTVSLDGINEGVTAAVCTADTANKGCVDKNGVGVFQPAAGSDYDHYVEVLLSIVNNGSKVWIADNLTLQLSETRKFPKNTVYTIDSLDGLELEPGDGITGSYFVLLPNVDNRDLIVIYGDGTEVGTFYFRLK